MNKIKPVFKKCGCGKRLTHHHILCDKCWRRKMQLKKQGFRTEPRAMKEFIYNETNQKAEEVEQEAETSTN